LPIERLDLGRRLKLRLITLICRLSGSSAIHLVVEAIEVYGLREVSDHLARPLVDPARARVTLTL
jgi:hypothetical protein